MLDSPLEMGADPLIPKGVNLDPLLVRSLRERIRVRIHLRMTERDTRSVRSVEGVVLEVLDGRDGRARLRVGIPTGSGEPVEVRVLLESVESVERVAVDEEPPKRPTMAQRPISRMRTLEYGMAEVSEALKPREATEARESGIRTTSPGEGPTDSWSKPPKAREGRG